MNLSEKFDMLLSGGEDEWMSGCRYEQVDQRVDDWRGRCTPYLWLSVWLLHCVWFVLQFCLLFSYLYFCLFMCLSLLFCFLICVLLFCIFVSCTLVFTCLPVLLFCITVSPSVYLHVFLVYLPFILVYFFLFVFYVKCLIHWSPFFAFFCFI